MAGKTEFEKKKERHASGESTMSADSVSNYIPTPPDGGYGWVIVFAAFFIHVIVDGIAFTFGIFYVEFLVYFGEGKGKTALVGSLLAGFYLLAAPVASGLINKFGTRVVAICGGLFAAFSFFISAWAPSIDVLMITYGVMGGSGLGFTYLPCIVAVSFYFQKRRAVATGIAVCGAGVGCFIFAPAGRMLLSVYDWQDAMLIVSGIVLNLCVFGALLRPLAPPRKKTKPRAKNIFDRVMEKARTTVGRKRQESECSACAHGVNKNILEKVEEVKLARQKALTDDESEYEFGSVPNSVVNSVRRLDSCPPSRQSSISVKRSDSLQKSVISNGVAGSPGGESLMVPTILIEQTEPMAEEDVSSEKKESGISSMSQSSDTGDELPELELDETSRIIPVPEKGVQFAGVDKSPTKNTLPKSQLDRVKKELNGNAIKMNGSLPTRLPQHTQQKIPINESSKQNGLLAPNAMQNNAASHSETIVWDNVPKISRRKCPPGVHREDYSRPMYRQDIFYSGSIIHIPEFQSQPTVHMYQKSVTSIPQVTPDEKQSKCCPTMPKAFKDILSQMTDFSLLKDPVFLVVCLTNLFGAVGLFIPYIYVADRSISLGVPESKAAFLLSVIGITNTGGRVVAGALADVKSVNTLALHNSALIIGGLTCILNHFCTTYATMCVFAVIFGLCVATWISLTSIVLCDLLGIQKLTNAFGLLTMARGAASIAGPPIAGFVFDATQDFNASFHVGGGMLLLAGLFCCLLHLPFFKLKTIENLESDLCAMDIGPLPDGSDDDLFNENTPPV